MLALTAVGQGIEVEGFWVLSTWQLKAALNYDSHLAWKNRLSQATASQRQSCPHGTCTCTSTTRRYMRASRTDMPSWNRWVVWFCIIWCCRHYLVLRAPSCIVIGRTLVPLVVTVYVMAAKHLSISPIPGTSNRGQRMPATSAYRAVRILFIAISWALAVLVEQALRLNIWLPIYVGVRERLVDRRIFYNTTNYRARPGMRYG